MRRYVRNSRFIELLTRSAPAGAHLRARKHQAGFTLIEMLVVLVIMGLVMGLVGPRVLSYLSDARLKAAHLQIASFSNSLDLFYLDVGRYPTTQEGLGALVHRPPGIDVWNGPYLKGAVIPADPWRNKFVYIAPGAHGSYDLMSYGSDGRDGGTGSAADITNWQQEGATGSSTAAVR
jgi:general secretion pathway protein G